MSGGTDAVLEVLASLGNGVDDQVLVDSTTPGEQGRRQRDADGPADVSHQVEKSAGVADLLVAQGAVGRGIDGHEDEAEAESGDQNRQKKRRGRYIEGDGPEVEGGESEDEEPEGEEVAGVGLVRQITDDGHSADGSEAPRRDDETGGEGGVAEQLLIEEGRATTVE